MRLFLLLIVCSLLSSCATRYIIPGTRFITPESQGGVFNSQFEMHGTQGNQLSINSGNGDLDSGVLYNNLARTGYLFSTSLWEEFDFFWSHTSSANSMIGGKLQLLGGSRASRAIGHKLALAAALGGNEHVTEVDPIIQFNLSGTEILLLYGYRFADFFLTYLNASYASYKFEGQVKSGIFQGLEPRLKSDVLASYAGVEISYNNFHFKLECGYQQLLTTNSPEYGNLLYGYSLGFSW